jgi:hypothetical protein
MSGESLVRQCVAEGFAVGKENNTPEVVAGVKFHETHHQEHAASNGQMSLAG